MEANGNTHSLYAVRSKRLSDQEESISHEREFGTECQIWNCNVDNLKLDWGKPKCLYRAFDTIEYAELFVDSGKIRLRNIYYYVFVAGNIKPSAKDSYEGRFDYLIGNDGGKRRAGGAYVLPSVIYILSLSGPNVNLSRLRSEYGEYVVRIDDPQRFASDLAKDLNPMFRLECLKVDYREFVVKEGDIRLFTVENKPSKDDLRWTYSRKHSDFSEDEEYRVAVVPSRSGGVCQGLDFDLGMPLSYAELL